MNATNPTSTTLAATDLLRVTEYPRKDFALPAGPSGGKVITLQLVFESVSEVFGEDLDSQIAQVKKLEGGAA